MVHGSDSVELAGNILTDPSIEAHKTRGMNLYLCNLSLSIRAVIFGRSPLVVTPKNSSWPRREIARRKVS